MGKHKKIKLIKWNKDADVLTDITEKLKERQTQILDNITRTVENGFDEINSTLRGFQDYFIETNRHLSNISYYLSVLSSHKSS